MHMHLPANNLSGTFTTQITLSLLAPETLRGVDRAFRACMKMGHLISGQASFKNLARVKMILTALGHVQSSET